MKTNPFLTHLSLNTGLVRLTPLAEVPAHIIDLLRPIVQHGSGPIPNTRWQCVLMFINGGALFDIRLNEFHIAHAGGVAWTPQASEKIWPTIESLYHVVTDDMLQAGHALPEKAMAQSEQPAELPWLGSVLMPAGFMSTTPSDRLWMTAFERCLAWTLIESAKGPARMPRS